MPNVQHPNCPSKVKWGLLGPTSMPEPHWGCPPTKPYPVPAGWTLPPHTHTAKPRTLFAALQPPQLLLALTAVPFPMPSWHRSPADKAGNPP